MQLALDRKTYYYYSASELGTREPVRREINAYPNPFQGTSIIELPESEFVRDFRLYDISGRIIRAEAEIIGNMVILYREGLSPGIYLFSLRGDRQYTGRIILQ